MVKNCLLLILSLYSYVAMAVNGSSVPALNLGVSDGLSCALAYDLEKDEQGYLWISNRMGVDRYDGYTFKKYHLTELSDDVLLLNDGKFHHLMRDDQGNLICYTDRGKVFRYNVNTDCFDLIYNASFILGRHSLHTAALSGDTLILGMYNGLYRVNLKTQQIESHLSISHNIRTIVPYVGGTYLVGSDHGIGCLDVSLDSCFALGLSDLDIKTIYYDADQQRIWMGTNGSGLWTMRVDGSRAKQVANWENAIVMKILPMGDSRLLVGTDGNGLLETSRRMLSPLQQIAMDIPGSRYLLPGAGIQSLLVDGNNIWLTIFDCGISLIRPTLAVQCLRHPYASFESEQRVNDVSVDNDGHIWTAYHNSIAEFDLQTGTSRAFEFEKGNFLSICAASDGTVWCGGYNSGLYRFDPATGKRCHINSLEDRSVNSNVYSIIEDSKQRIWVGSQFSPLTCFVSSDIDGKDCIPPLSQTRQYDVSRINDIGELCDEKMAIATSDGVVILDVASSKTDFVFNERDSLWVGTNFISCLETDRSHTVFVGTDGSGLIIYNVQTGAREHFTNRDGLPSNFLRSIENVGDSLLWISTETEGIFSFNLKNRNVQQTVTHSRGLTTEGFVQEASCHMPNGNVVFGGKGGIEVINPKDLVGVSENIRFQISEINLSQKQRISFLSHPEILNAPLSEIDQIVLPYGEHSIQIAFSVVDLYHNSDYRLVYSLGGGEDVWLPLDNQRVVTFYSLPAGTHTLAVRCMRGETLIAEKNLDIIALQTIWLQWPAITIYVILVILLILGIFVIFVNSIEHNASEEKIRFFNSVAHDIRTPLSLVMSPLADLEQYISPNVPSSLMPLIKRNLQHLNEVVNQLSLFNNTHNKQAFKIEPVQICDFMKNVQESYRTLAEHHELNLEVNLPQEDIWVYADVKIFARIVDNIMGNAFKFTHKGGITVTVSRHGQKGVIQISDTGIGMSESTRKRLFRHFFRGENAVNGRIPGLGLGMMYTYQAVRQMQGRIDCQSQEGKGTTFTLSLPVSPAGETASYDSSTSIIDIQEQSGKLIYSGNRHDILLVEDNEELLDYMKQKLGEGYNVISASCVADAKQQLRKHYPDLIISDIMMPGVHGDEWCFELKQSIETSHIPVILLTANSDYQSQVHGFNMGADDYVTKPFDVNLLLLKIRNIFETRQKMQAHYMHLMQMGTKTNVIANEVPAVPSAEPSLCGMKSEDQFVKRLMQVMEKYLSDPNLSIHQLASEMAMSQSLLYEKINKVLGMPPAALIRSFRMKKAKSLLLEGKYSVTEVSVMCGFSDAKYFGTSFKKFYGVTPSKCNELEK